MDEDIIINKYIRIFQRCLEEELTLVEERAKPTIVEISTTWTTRTLLYAYGDPKTLSSVVQSIFQTTEVRDFVYGLTMRFLIKIAGNEDISWPELINIVTSWCMDGGNLARASETIQKTITSEQYINEFVLIPKEVPTDIRNTLLGVTTNIAIILDANRFLIVPIMFNIGGLAEDTSTGAGASTRQS